MRTIGSGARSPGARPPTVHKTPGMVATWRHRSPAITPQELEQLRAEAAVALLADAPPPPLVWPPPSNVPACRDCGGRGTVQATSPRFGPYYEACSTCNGWGWSLP